MQAGPASPPAGDCDYSQLTGCEAFTREDCSFQVKNISSFQASAAVLWDSDPDPVESALIWRIPIRIHFNQM
jgi:hypothetical protein